MRAILAGLAALALAACSEAELAGAPEDAPGGYTLEVRANGDAQVFLVTGPDGRSTAGRAAGGVSALMDTEAARAFTVLPENEEPLPEVMSLRLPGLNLSIAAEGDTGEEGARVSINAGGRQVEVNARDNDAGDTERAHVRITGASESEARNFIAEADKLSPEVQSEMLAALGLS
ncbi:MAG TPA: hypothetical protein PLS69_05980 [Terricaulis sp.]|nr:hypothetical protein [Terricaulis sp.]